MSGEQTQDFGSSIAAEYFGGAPDLNRDLDRALIKRAQAVIPDGMFGHVRAWTLQPGYPQFYSRSLGSRVWDVDGNEYLDFMCSWGPITLGYNNPEVEAAATRQREQQAIGAGPTPLMVELAERVVDLIPQADWVVFAKNGCDVTTTAVTIARAGTGKKKIIKARGSYHGAVPWCSPNMSGVTPEDRAHIIEIEYNDVSSLSVAADLAGDDLAGVILTPHKHDVRADQEPILPEFARAVRDLCDRKGAALIHDEVRTGFRVGLHGSWEPLGIEPDLVAYSKAIANGHSLAALTGIDALRDAAASVTITGTFWYDAPPMAAALVTINTLEEIDGPAIMGARGRRLMTGLAEQASSYGVKISLTGPPQMPYLRFVSDDSAGMANLWCSEALRRGVLFHPYHNWFVSTSHTENDIDRALEATDGAFALVAKETLVSG
jgi:glutamate-1-semialdehyde 2,1-aminomutase